MVFPLFSAPQDVYSSLGMAWWMLCVHFAQAKNPSKTCSDFVESVQKNLKRAILFAQKVAKVAKNDLCNISTVKEM